MFGQWSAYYAATIGSHLLAKVHHLESSLGAVNCHQNHLVDCLSKRINFVGEVSDRVDCVVDKLNGCINAQDIQIEQLANMINDLVRKVEGQAKEIKMLKTN